MAVRRQHPEPENPPQDNWRAGPGGVPIPPKSRQASKAPTYGNGEVRKAATPATRAEVRLAAIQCVVPATKMGRVSLRYRIFRYAEIS